MNPLETAVLQMLALFVRMYIYVNMETFSTMSASRFTNLANKIINAAGAEEIK